MAKILSSSEVASHNKPDDLWIIVDEEVYDLTTFQDEHPGGKKILQRVGGKDASKQFWKYHNAGILRKYKGKLQVGALDTKKQEQQQQHQQQGAAPTPPSTPPRNADDFKKVVTPSAESGHVAPMPGPAASEMAEPLEPFGELVPFGDPSWYQGVSWRETKMVLNVVLMKSSSPRHTTRRRTRRCAPRCVNGSTRMSNRM